MNAGQSCYTVRCETYRGDRFTYISPVAFLNVADKLNVRLRAYEDLCLGKFCVNIAKIYKYNSIRD